MTDCGCDKAKLELEEYIHQELRSAEAADVREHLAHCDDCSGEELVGRALLEVVQRACQEKAPDELRIMVMQRIRVEIGSLTVR